MPELPVRVVGQPEARGRRVTGKIVIRATGQRGKRAAAQEFGFDEPSPTVQKMGLGDQRPRDVLVVDDGRPDAPADEGKPPYRVPLVSEILAMPRSGLTCMSTFSGCGGSCLGFEWAGYRPLLAVEFVPAAADSYEANHVGVPVYRDDIRSLTAKKALEIMGLAKGELDVLEGSPPCESFSTAGKLAAGWGTERNYSDGKRQRMDDLFFEFTRLLGGIKPRAFMAENVAGLARGVSKGYFQNIHRELERQGYRVKARMLDAQWLGVPQRRKRVIFVGVRKDLKLDPVFPAPLPYRYSIRDALHDLARVEAVSSRDGHEYARKDIDPDEPVNTILRGGAALQRYEVVGITHDTGGTHSLGDLDLDEPVPTIVNSSPRENRSHFKVRDREIVGVVGGWPRRYMSADEPAATIGKGGYTASGEHEVIERLVYDNSGRGGAAQTGRDEEDLDAPVRAITKAGGAAPFHFKVESQPGEPRKFTIAELRRLCGFPDDFALTGTYSQQWERLGNSVPPPMAYHIASAIRDLLLAATPPASPGGASRRTAAARRPR